MVQVVRREDIECVPDKQKKSKHQEKERTRMTKKQKDKVRNQYTFLRRKLKDLLTKIKKVKNLSEVVNNHFRLSGQGKKPIYVSTKPKI